jgi:multiple sugar transport system permease protein
MADLISTARSRLPFRTPTTVRKGSPSSRREAITGYWFVAPSVLGFLIFVLGPLAAVLYFSFTKYDVISRPTFVGLQNYARLFSDARLGTVYFNTIIYVIAAVVFINVFAVIFAVLVNQRMPRFMTVIFRSVYFVPSLVSLVYVALIWQALFQRDTGIVNYYIQALGGQPLSWLTDDAQARWSVIIVDVWRNIGFAMLIYTAALQEVPRELEEAAKIDGAGPITIFRKVTVPMISQAIFFNITITVIGAFQIYESIIVLTGGGPGDATRSIVMYIAERAFSDFQIGYASAISVTLFVIILLVTLVQFRLRKRWVHYE